MDVFQALHFVFGIFGNATGLFLFLAPMVTFRRIIKNKSTEQFSGIPYNMTLLNCLLSAWYGLPFVSPNNMLVYTINGTGAVLEAIYVTIFIVHAPRKGKLRMLGLLALVLTVFAAVSLVSVLALHGQKRKLLCGFAAAIFSICMYASPLSVMRLVIRTKSVEFMPFFLSLFVFLCGTSWFVFGLLGRDPFIAVPSQLGGSPVEGASSMAPGGRSSTPATFPPPPLRKKQKNTLPIEKKKKKMWQVPNGFGSGLGAIQLVLYAIYRDRKESRLEDQGKAEFIEMGTAKPQQMSKGAQTINGLPPSKEAQDYKAPPATEQVPPV